LVNHPALQELNEHELFALEGGGPVAKAISGTLGGIGMASGYIGIVVGAVTLNPIIAGAGIAALGGGIGAVSWRG
jgi:hypothetical protein